MTGPRLAPIVAVVTAADMRAVTEAAASHETYPGTTVELATVIDLAAWREAHA